MRKLYNRIAPVLLSCLFTLAYASQVMGQDGFAVDEVKFHGNETFSDGDLQEQISLRGFNMPQRWFLRKEPSRYNPDILANDLIRLTRFYQRRGFLDVRVTRGPLRVDDKRNEMGIAILIDEGEPMMVDSVKWEIAGSSSSDSLRVDTLMARLIPVRKLQPGIRFQDQLVATDANLFESVLADNGFPYAEAAHSIRVDTLRHTVALAWSIDSGPRCVFGDISMSGHQRASDALVSRQLTFSSGQLFRQSKLDDSQRQIIELGTFEVTTVTGVLDRGRVERVPVRITLREAPRLSSKIGVGYGREDNLRIFTESRLLGVLGGARRLEFFGKYSGLEPYHIRLKFTQPSFLTPRTSGTLSPFARRQHEPGFKLSRRGGSAGLDHRVTRRLNVSAEYSFERVDLDTASLANEGVIIPGLEDLYNKSSVLMGTTYDNSSPPFSPERGNFSALTTKFSGLGLGSDYHYVRLLCDTRHYERLFGIVVASRLKIGGIHSFDDDEFVPVEDRFFAGGSSSLRGWARGEIGPEADGTPIGGKSLLEMSIELRIPIWGILSGAVFTDAGNVWRESFIYAINEIRYSAGAGLRFATPIGPIRLDLARPIHDDEFAYELHINVGQAF